MLNSSQNLPLKSPDSALPLNYWEELSEDDKIEFIRLRNQFHQNQKISVKDGRLVSFHQEMVMVMKFLERSENGREQRSILTGIAFAGTYICVNTRQLKSFLGRCKSSINGSLQQLGYVAIKTKSKARQCVLSLIPALQAEPVILRQWTVRGASEDAMYCFVPGYDIQSLPKITEEDLFEEKKSIQQKPVARTISRPNPPSLLPNVLSSITQTSFNQTKSKQTIFDIDLSVYDDISPDPFLDIPDITSSLSYNTFNSPDEWEEPVLSRSHSAFIRKDQDLLELNILMFD